MLQNTRSLTVEEKMLIASAVHNIFHVRPCEIEGSVTDNNINVSFPEYLRHLVFTQRATVLKACQRMLHNVISVG